MTLRTRLTAYYTLFFALALLILGTGLYLGVRHLLWQSVLDELHVGSALVQQAYQSGDRSLSNIVWPRTPILYMQIIDPGSSIAQTKTLPGDFLPITAEQLATVLSGNEVTVIHSVDSTRVLSLITPLRLGPRIVGAIQVAQSLRYIDQSLTALAWALLGGGLITLLVAARGGLWLAHAALQPIDQISATAARIIKAEDLRQRVPDTATDDELGRLTRTINQMLERMERIFEVQQRFTADMAHELRTPLAAMRGNLEILRRGARHDPEMLAESLHDIESEVLRLSRMANDLLILAQADAGVPLRLSDVALDEVVLEVYRELRPLADGVQLRVDLQDQVMIAGDRDRLKQALLNLLANALQYTPADGSIVLGLRREGTFALLEVTDTGPGIRDEHLPYLFDRFYRGDRARAHGGAGLGLAIVKWVAEAHGGQVKVATEPERGTTFTIQLPLQSAPSSEAYDHSLTTGQSRATADPDVHHAYGNEPAH